MADTQNCDCLSQEAQLDSELRNVSHIDSLFATPSEIESDMERVIEVSARYTGLETEDIKVNVDNANLTISAVKKTYVHEQSVASATWEIQHNLDRYPSVTVVDSAGDVVHCDAKYIDRNNVRLDFSAEFGGKAYLN